VVSKRKYNIVSFCYLFLDNLAFWYLRWKQCNIRNLLKQKLGLGEVLNCQSDSRC